MVSHSPDRPDPAILAEGRTPPFESCIGLAQRPSTDRANLFASFKYQLEGGIETVGASQTVARCQLEQEAGIPVERRAFCNRIVFTPVDPSLDPSLRIVPEYANVEAVDASQENTSRYWSRGIDYPVTYFTSLGGGGQIPARALVTRFLEQSRDLGGYFGRRNVAGQTGANGLGEFFGSFGINYSPTPKISGNLLMTYAKNAFTVTAQTRYVGAGRLNLQSGWIGPGGLNTTYVSGMGRQYRVGAFASGVWVFEQMAFVLWSILLAIFRFLARLGDGTGRRLGVK